jgi:hypothetical protein
MKEFLHALEVQRWDDHRFYHHSRINQSLHFISAASFIVAYAFLFVDPAVSALIGWLISMTTRQSGHFFFEPLGYDEVNQVTNEYKEAVKVGYNLKRKAVLIGVWALSPLVLQLDPSLFGLMTPHESAWEFVHNVGYIWLALGVAGHHDDRQERVGRIGFGAHLAHELVSSAGDIRHEVLMRLSLTNRMRSFFCVIFPVFPSCFSLVD